MDGPRWLRELHRDDRGYDLLLTGIPIVFVLTYLVVTAHVTGRSPALVVASIASGLLVVAALFFDPPSRTSR